MSLEDVRYHAQLLVERIHRGDLYANFALATLDALDEVEARVTRVGLSAAISTAADIRAAIVRNLAARRAGCAR